MSYDMQISTDAFNGDPWSEHNPINTGFYYVQSNNKTIRMFKTWYKLRESKVKEQDVLARMSRKGLLREMGLVVRCLDVLYFSGFCSDSNDVSVVSTVHANCCKTIRAKVDDLRNVLRDWKTYRNMSTSINFKWTEHVACKNSWKTSCNTTKTMHCM
ncbi:unnamed protein product [Cuscuta epithymum]|uniref:Nucleotide-diphospho-sugar transferase domain-containing protein n=1 Tax=Cuscuta epithymum TaxID=186058 RepID=A0AAV0DB48_9ASTE|nr:unnamed protein product [Cuscuta epithymum]